MRWGQACAGVATADPTPGRHQGGAAVARGRGQAPRPPRSCAAPTTEGELQRAGPSSRGTHVPRPGCRERCQLGPQKHKFPKAPQSVEVAAGTWVASLATVGEGSWLPGKRGAGRGAEQGRGHGQGVDPPEGRTGPAGSEARGGSCTATPGALSPATRPH